MGFAFSIQSALTLLAQQASESDDSLPPEVRSRAFAIVLLTALLGVIGIVVILLLGVTWRRYNKRVTGEKKEAAEEIDPWSTSAQRAKADDDSEDDGDSGDEDEDDADDDDDRNKPRGKGPNTGTGGPPPVGV